MQRDRGQRQGDVNLHRAGRHPAETLHRATDSGACESKGAAADVSVPTVKRPDSVRFQKDFQKFMSRF